MKDLLKSFVYAFQGIFACIKKERNLRIHITVATYMFCYLGIYDWFEISRTQYAILFVMCALVISGELVNTALERAVDLASPGQNDIAKLAKDCAAGAVLVSAIFAVLCGIAIMFQPEAFRKMAEYYSTHIYMLFILAASLVLSMFFIFKGTPGNKKG